MKLVPFCILTALAVLYAGLTVAESALYQTWDRALNDQKELQNKVAFYQRLDGTINLLLRRMAVDSRRDPALVKLLNEHGIKVVFSSPETMGTPGAPVENAPDSANKPPSSAPAPQ